MAVTRRPTPDEVAEVKREADNPRVGRSAMADRLGCKIPFVERIIRENSIPWKENPKPNKIELDENELARFKVMAADPRISYREAARIMGMNSGTIKRLASEHGIPWEAKSVTKDPDKEPTLPVANGHGQAWRDWHIRAPSNPRMKAAPKVKMPPVKVWPEVRHGTPGMAFHCAALSLFGWCAGEDVDDLRERIHHQVALPIHRLGQAHKE